MKGGRDPAIQPAGLPRAMSAARIPGRPPLPALGTTADPPGWKRQAGPGQPRLPDLPGPAARRAGRSALLALAADPVYLSAVPAAAGSRPPGCPKQTPGCRASRWKAELALLLLGLPGPLAVKLALPPPEPTYLDAGDLSWPRLPPPPWPSRTAAARGGAQGLACTTCARASAHTWRCSRCELNAAQVFWRTAWDWRLALCSSYADANLQLQHSLPPQRRAPGRDAQLLLIHRPPFAHLQHLLPRLGYGIARASPPN